MLVDACGRLWTGTTSLRCGNPTHLLSDPDRASQPDPGEAPPWASGWVRHEVLLAFKMYLVVNRENKTKTQT
eukprot:6099174-Pyramimonas_sp.AAC.1